MLSRIRRILGAIQVTETATHITVSGLSTQAMENAIQRVWKTSRITAHIFSSSSGSSFSFPRFFAPEVVYIIDSLLNIKDRYFYIERRTLTKLHDLLLTETWLAQTLVPATPVLNRKALSKFFFAPKDYQDGFFDTYDRLVAPYNLRGYLLAAAAGSGKTYTSLALAEMLGAQRIVVLAPKLAIYRVWEKSILELYREPPSFWIADQNRPLKDERILVFHYERLSELKALTQTLANENVVMIVDESHNFNDDKSQRTQELIKVVKAINPMSVVPMSGTPLKALGAEAVPLLMMIDPLFNDDVMNRFKKIFGREGKKGLDILNHRIGVISYKVEKHQLGLDKPLLKAYPVKLPANVAAQYTLPEIRKDMQAFIEERVKYYTKRRPDDQRFYDQCMAIAKAKLSGQNANDLSTYVRYVAMIQRAGGDARQVGAEIVYTNQFEKTVIIPILPKEHVARFKDVKSVIKYVNLKIQGEALGRVLGRKRIACHVAMIPFIDFEKVMESTPKKTVVFTSFVEALEATDKQLSAKGLNPITVYGKTNQELPKSVALFEKHEDVNPLCATYQSLATAVPLTMADTMIMIDSPFRAYIHEQAISRIHRLGADTQTVVYQCTLDTGDIPNISTRSADILLWSQEQVQAIMGIENPFEFEERIDKFVISNEAFGLEETVDYPEVIETYLGAPLSYQESLEAW